MDNPFEQQKTSTNEKTRVNKKEETISPKNHSDYIKEAVEYKTGKKLPEDKEELFRNFDELIPEEIDHIDIADKVKSEDEHASLYRYSREGIRSNLERELYGSTTKEVGDYFRKELESIEKELQKTQRSRDFEYKKDFDPKLLARHDKYVDLFNQISAGAIENPLTEIELQINSNFTNESEKDNLRKFAERLSAEMYKNRPKNKIGVDDIKKQIEKESAFFSDVDDENVKSDNEEHFKRVLENLNKGELTSASEEIEFNIGWIQERLEERKNTGLKDVSEKMLKKRYGENFMPAINEELGKLREYRKFLRSRESGKEEKEHRKNKNEQTQPENKEASEKKEQAEKAAKEEELKQVRNKIDWAVSPNEKLKESLDGNLDEKISRIEQEVEALNGGDYLSSEEKDRILEKFDKKSIENITGNISKKIKELGLFEDKRVLGIDVWNPRLEDSKLPFTFFHERVLGHEKFKTKDMQSGYAYYNNGVVLMNFEAPTPEIRLRNWIDGYIGDGTLSHETLHGFQTADVQLCQEFAEMELEYKSIDNAKLTNEDIDNYHKKKRELKQRWAEKLGIEPDKIENAINGKNPNDAPEDYKARWALREVHSYWARINHEGVDNREKVIGETVVGRYKLPLKATVKGIELIKQMKALNIDDKTIGKLIFMTKIDLSSKEIFVDLSKFVDDFKNNNGISDGAMQKLVKLADLEEAKELLMLKNIANQETSDYYQENRNLRDAVKDWFRKRFKK